MESNRSHPTNQKSPGFLLSAALFLFLLAVYLLTYTPRINSSDGLAMFATAESLVRRGALDVEQIRWMGLQQGTYGLDGLLYSRKGIGLPVGLLPLTWLGLVIPWFGPVGASLLFNALVTALAGVLLLAYLAGLGFGQRTGLIVALTFGLGTLAWPYAKSLFSDPFSGLLLLAAACLLLKFRHSFSTSNTFAPKENIQPGEEKLGNQFPSSVPLLSCSLPCLSYPFLAGLLLGWNVATRYAEAIFLPLYGLLLLYYLFTVHTPRIDDQELRISPKPPRGTHHVSRFTFHVSRLVIQNPKSKIRNLLFPLLAFTLPPLLIGLGLIAFNLSRYGDPLNTGYLPNETFSAIWWQGISGQLFSPGRGLLLYCPIFILSFAGLVPFFRRFRAEALLALGVILIHLLLYGKWFMWHGGFAWGPRFMVPTLSFWALFLAPIAARAFGGQPAMVGGRWWRIAYGSLATLSLIPQLLTVTIDFSPFQGWLLDTGLPLFDPQTFFDPRYTPLLRAWGFIDRASLDLAWAWPDRFTGGLLALLLVNLGLAGLFLWQATRLTSRPAESAATRRIGLLALLSNLISLTMLLTHTHGLPEPALQAAVAALNQAVRPEDAIIINDPDITIPFAELYRRRAPVLGLNTGGFPLPQDIERRVAETTAGHAQVWWLPNWLPPEQSAVEQILLATGFRARQETFDGHRLLLFGFPPELTSRPVDALFAGQIKLDALALPPRPEPGSALSVALTWQAQAPIEQDYHVFIHLVQGDGSRVAQADGQPAQWTRPTSSWVLGETVVDRHGLWLPTALSPGSYELRVGLYHPAGGQRLRLPTGEDSLKIDLIIQ